MTTSTDPESSTPTAPAKKPRNLRLPVASRVSIQSKLLMMLLVTSVLSAAVVGAIGYQSGRSSLRESVFDRLTEIRQSQSRQLREGIGDLKNSLVIYSRGATSIQAIQAFTAGFDQLNTATISPAQQQSLVDYYTNQFAPTKKSIGEDVDVDAVLPDTNAARYLQAYYTAPFSDWDESTKFDDAHDGSAWSAPTPSVLPPSFRWTTRPTTSSRC